ncbi:class I SAM-dependent methyltransferase [Pseudoxanthomonas daejeonensis]|uniref:class I SAM-dependent methyltransferase n=1 Tax=Pseudoxanthomonas daejeonensis TaxID=266062 RepID=UPI001F543020|nr:class I SAM-dependent methyltransferase [Pseudoxanthomonas daejeonensis]UNK56304.1 class I SAM-dependent methyltransferase [Pseudoxanthomonas daejeonensis]
MSDTQTTLDHDRLDQFLGAAVVDLGAAISASLVLVGDRLGFYKALAQAPATPAELATRTGTHERYVREWLGNQAAGGYVQYDPADGRYRLDQAQALCLADPGGPVDLPGAYYLIEATFHALDRTVENFRSGRGMEWGEHHACLFHGTERFFRAGYNAHLLGEWLPALEGVTAKLEQGAKVADIGCGHGASTVLMAHAYPRSEFIGYDYHADSIRIASERAAAAGLGNARFEVADATGYAARGFDLIAFFDCLHDMGDPVGAARHARQALADDGTCLLVEPFAGDRVEDNLNPVGRVYYGASSQICVPVSLARNGPALGAQAGEARLRQVMTEAGFSRFRRATETPFNLVLEARP